MKIGWVTKRLGEVCEIINGKNQSEVTDPSGAYPIYGSGGIMGRASAFRCPAGCTVIGRKGSINNPLFVDEKFWNVDTAYALSPVGVEPKYLFYFCRSYDFSVLNCGTTIPSLTTAIVKDVQIPIPPLAEQKRIVAKIDAAFEKINKLKANAERNLKNAKELFQSALNEAMRPKPGWVEKRLGEIAEFKNGLNFKRKAGGCKVSIVGVSDFSRTSSIEDCTPLGSVEIEDVPGAEWYLHPDDFVFVRSNGSKKLVGRVLHIKTDRQVTFSGFCIRMRMADKSLLPGFLFLQVSTEAFRERLLSGRNSSTINNVTQPILSAMAVVVPPIKEQKTILEDCERLMKNVQTLQSNYTRLIADCAEMRQAVLKDAFEGRL